MWSAIQTHAAKHALFYAIALGLGGQALFTGFYDNFWAITPADMKTLGWWQITALLCKSFSFSIGIVVGYLIKAPNGDIVGDTKSLTTTVSTTKTNEKVN